VVIGTGPELKEIGKLAQPNVQVLGRNLITWWRNISLRQSICLRCCEDFGIALVEAQACTPVIAYGAGELWKRCGIFSTRSWNRSIFWAQTPAALVEAVESLKRTRGFNPEPHSCPVCPKNLQERYLAF